VLKDGLGRSLLQVATTNTMKPSRFRLKQLYFPLIVAITAMVTLIAGLSGIFSLQKSQPSVSVERPPLSQADVASIPTPSPASPGLSIWSQIPKASSSLTPNKMASPPPLPQSPKIDQTPQDNFSVRPSTTKQAYLPPVQQKYGHLSYGEAPGGRLISLSPPYFDRTESLIDSAADAFGRMQADAAQAGVKLIPISGFRSVADQVKLFERQIQRRGSEENAARLSAPPGYSEHHTGYALDIGDGSQTATDLKYEFENTAAYQWLRTHATQAYGFELSFPENNKQGVSFEPWHWRYTGSQEAAQVFTVAHRMF
jgi:zinc D-Ala-D-Ala carboxypeptidase